MKTTLATLIIALTIFNSCKKDPPIYSILNVVKNDSSGTSLKDNYNSINEFFEKNGVQMQHYTIDASAGGSFTTTQGTTVIIQPNSFIDLNGNGISGNVSIEFKDIYQKSDMLLSNVLTTQWDGKPLKSGGEFFIHVKQENNNLKLKQWFRITIKQPLSGNDLDIKMKAFIGFRDSLNVLTWGQPDNNNLAGATVIKDSATLANYVYTLYQLSDSGTWGNTDNPYFFPTAAPKTNLIIHANDSVSLFNTDVFMVFKNVNSVVHAYSINEHDFPYEYAPIGFNCTVVAIGIKEGMVFSAFVPITITENKIVDFTFSETTTEEFKTKLEELN